jgi:hypothetical protein
VDLEVFMKCPCMMCTPPVRHIGCHGACEEYKRFCDEQEAKKAIKADYFKKHPSVYIQRTKRK